MPPDFATPSVAELEFSLYSRPLHPELFRVFAEKRLSVEGLTVRLCLIGGGHLAEVVHGHGVLTEAAAARGECPPKAGLLHTIPFRGERTQDFTWRNGVRYCMALQVEQLSPPHYHKVHRELLDCGEHALFHGFEEPHPGRPGAFSYIDFELRRGEVLIQAFHAFPEELTIVRTQSLLEVPR